MKKVVEYIPYKILYAIRDAININMFIALKWYSSIDLKTNAAEKINIQNNHRGYLKKSG